MGENQQTDTAKPDDDQPPRSIEIDEYIYRNRNESTDYFKQVYNQYWEHARHNEDQLWSFTRAWALILTGIFATLGAPTETVTTGTKIGIAAFGIILSVLGFALVYAIRKPFLIYFRTVDRISRDWFNIPSEYLRVKEEMDHTLDKRVTTSFILFATYAGVTAILTAFIVVSYSNGWFGLNPLVTGIVLGVLVAASFAGCYRYIIRNTFEEICDDVITYNSEDDEYDAEGED